MKEFEITFKNDIKEDNPHSNITLVRAGEKLVISSKTFDTLKSGNTISAVERIGHGVTGSYSYSKKDLEKEVLEIEVIVNRKIRKFR